MKCSTCKGAGLLDHGLCDYPCEDCNGTGEAQNKKDAVDEIAKVCEVHIEARSDEVEEAINTAVNITTYSDCKRVQEMAEHIVNLLMKSKVTN